MRNKRPRQLDGTWFAVPLLDGGYGIGLVARYSPQVGVALCYFFAPRRESLPSVGDLTDYSAKDAIRVIRVSDIGLAEAEWPQIGRAGEWIRSEWPVPTFVRKDPLCERAWKIHYSDDDPRMMLGEEPEPYESELEKASIFGDQAIVRLLTHLLTGCSA